MLLSILDAIFCGEEKISWELHIIMKSLVDPKDREVKRRVRPILEWMIWICMKGRNKDTSAAETDMTVVTLPSQKLKSWQKLRLEGTVGKWPEARRVSATQIDAISEVAVAASLSVSQAESFFVRGANTAMTPLPPPPILHLSGLLTPSVLPATYQLFLQAIVSARISTFEMGGLPRSCLFLQRLYLRFFHS